MTQIIEIKPLESTPPSLWQRARLILVDILAIGLILAFIYGATQVMSRKDVQRENEKLQKKIDSLHQKTITYEIYSETLKQELRTMRHTKDSLENLIDYHIDLPSIQELRTRQK